MTQDIVEQWTELSRRDDLFNHMVPSDVRAMLGEISRARAEVKRLTFLKDEFKTCATAMQRGQDEAVADRKAAEAERDDALARITAFVMEAVAMPEPVNNPSNEYVQDWQYSYDMLRETVSEDLSTRARDMLEVVERAEAGAKHIQKNGLTIHERKQAALHHIQKIAQAVAKLNKRGE